jgi:hypothetical protein
MKRLMSFSMLIALAHAGCSEAQSPNEGEATKTKIVEATRSAAHDHRKSVRNVASPAAASDKGEAPASPRMTDGASVALVALQPGAPATPADTAGIARKIIYDSQVAVVVDSVEPSAKRVAQLVQDARGYVAEQNVIGSPGSLRAMHWRIRIPVEQFDRFVDSIVALGELERNNRTSQDVTEQYYDIEARIKNKKLEEQTLNKILQERSGKLEDVLKIEIELSRVRGEIEQLEGKIRVLANLSSLATITLDIREREKYAPAAPVVASFPTQIGRTWDSSILSLQEHGKSVVLWVVGAAIWIPFWVVGAIIAWVLVRKLIRAFIRNLPRLVALARTPLSRPRAPTTTE